MEAISIEVTLKWIQYSAQTPALRGQL